VAQQAPTVGFLTHLESQNLLEGEPLLLVCTSFAPQPVELTWLRNGKQIPENPDFIRQHTDNTFSLLVNEIFPEDSGVFTAELHCPAAGHTVLSSCSVVVQARDEPGLDPKFLRFPTSFNLQVGSPVNVETTIEASAPLSIKWFKNNKELSSSEHIKLTSNGNTYSLAIGAVLTSDNGQYHVYASNAHGEAIAAFSLIV